MKKGKPFIIVGSAIVMLIGLSLLPWSRWTNGFIKDFTLFQDLFGIDWSSVSASEPIDPELTKALSAGVDDTPAPGDSSATTPRSPEHVVAPKHPRINGEMAIEDYTANGQGLANLRRALANRGERTARIAVIGDSYIEGDILTQDIRADLQDLYGGSGVGYMPVSSELTGFRTSVKQTCSGWTGHDIRKNADNRYKSLAGEYFTSSAGARSTFSGSARLPHQSSWNQTRFAFVSPKSGTVTLGNDGGQRTFSVSGNADSVQVVSLPGSTGSASVSTDISGLQALGMYLDDGTGVAVDNMSLRGNSGISHRKINKKLATQMRKAGIDYDLIIVEYGINALSSTQKNYDGYRKLMQQTLGQLKACYPIADIIMMGIGDRGQKIGGQVLSVPTSQAMIDAQRDAARNAGVLFWDTREAMGGDNAVLTWRENGFINPDYIHLNAKGGKKLADIFVASLKKML